MLQVFAIELPPPKPDQRSFADLRDELRQRALGSAFSLASPVFYSLFPFHFVLDQSCRVLQARGGALHACAALA